MSDRTKSKSFALTAAALALGSAIGANMQTALAIEPAIDPKVTDLNKNLKASEPTRIDATQIKMEDTIQPKVPVDYDGSKIDSKQMKVETPKNIVPRQ